MALYIIGTGPGDPELITIKGLNTLMRCNVVAGWKSVISRFAEYVINKLVIELNYKDEERLLRRVVEIAVNKEVCFLMHGDPSVSERQLMNKLRSLAEEYGVELVIIPGVSSILHALSLLGRDLADVVFITLHERNPRFEEIALFAGLGRDLLILPPPYSDGIGELARELIKHYGDNHEVFILENLTLNNERVIKVRLRELLMYKIETNLVIIYVPGRK
ncbi:cobalt-precorrin-7 (C(5))-methyltransferase [Vulcanisaeta sp. JCM 16161]|uniref:precorrin-6y C5,15-methyltransferase (decarboxylating) subunit CbiE n=1 Tax=Vulcanisaeta sp. JCM 16161 TaxID=1295372 RepID=UPI001FB1ED5D|nr:precorrin-6y C5,15-methyltransferase (decarboxylating) subunit CbiE [Vulcanisaeta sp. JCM 16161]